MSRRIELKVNGVSHQAEVSPGTSLLTLLREHLGLTGTKRGCEEGECGACVVLWDGRPVTTCLILAVEAGGSHLTTVEGLGSPAYLHFTSNETIQGVQGFQVRRAAERYLENIQYGFLGSGQVPRERMLRY